MSNTCSYDYLEINSGSYAVTLCGSTIPEDVTTATNTATVTFVSDGSIRNTGFEFTYDESSGGKWDLKPILPTHYNDVIMGTMASQVTSLAIVYSTVYSGADQRKHQCSASLAFVRGIHRWQVNFPHKWPVTRKMFPFDDVIMINHL